jgi:hypothetical protein
VNAIKDESTIACRSKGYGEPAIVLDACPDLCLTREIHGPHSHPDRLCEGHSSFLSGWFRGKRLRAARCILATLSLEFLLLHLFRLDDFFHSFLSKHVKFEGT